METELQIALEGKLIEIKYFLLLLSAHQFILNFICPQTSLEHKESKILGVQLEVSNQKKGGPPFG